MSMRHVCRWWLAAAVVALLASRTLPANAQQPSQPAVESGLEVLTRGPVHEAFAETISFDPEPGIIVPKPPPDPIEELPPDQKPAGENVDWIPGYWAWDDERSDFLWVSGIWRSLPPGRQWVPGYWGKSGQGFQWTSGYWADAKASEIDYLPEPPETVETGPNAPAPSADHIWLPGSWVWQQNRYAWRPGYWAVAQPNWVWIPDHYVWSPRGYVFVDGYYDYSVARRGVLFAPVYFSANVYTRPGYSYSPRTIINPAVFTSHLFLRPSYGHYYFGDYYNPTYTTRGYSPWFAYSSSRSGYDPFYAHQRWHHRTDREWDRRVEADFARRRDHEEARPPHNWDAQRDRSRQTAPRDDQSWAVAASLDEIAKRKEAPLPFQPVPKESRQQIEQRAREVRQTRQERQQLETAGAVPQVGAAAKPFSPGRLKLPKTPLVAPPPDRLGKEHAPPARIEMPRPDPRIEPKPRKARGEAPRADGPKATQPGPRPSRREAEPKGSSKPERSADSRDAGKNKPKN